MADEVSPSQARARQFDVVRRGYDRAQVDIYIEELSSLLDDLQSAADEAEASALSIGIDDPEALANELGRIGAEVGAILEASRTAAEGLRKRASKDAEKWRKKAESESGSMLADAIEQSQSMRAAAWKEGSAMLSSAIGTSRGLINEAQEDAMFMRAEAERDALRLTSDARRDKEEALRAARQEGEAIIVEARAESDGVLAAAQKQAESAQERARALEDRRSELLAELEATRASISHLEDEIDSRRQELEAPEEPELIEAESRHIGMDVSSVRIVAPSRAVTLQPVDTDELVAEVFAMRSAAALAEAAALATADREATQPETLAVISPPSPAPAPAPATEPAPAPAPEPEPAPVPVQPTPTVDPTPSTDDISSLFAKLRDEGQTSEVRSQKSEDRPDAVPPSGGRASLRTPSSSQMSDVRSQKTEDRPDAVPPSGGTDERSESGGRVSLRTPSAVESGMSDVRRPTSVQSTHNAALKQIKKVLVELQNETLEALRTDTSWVPPAGFADHFDEPFVEVADEVGSSAGRADASAFASDLEDAVTNAIEEARTAGKGDRAVAAQASKVFRLWRTDEAERRLRSIS